MLPIMTLVVALQSRERDLEPQTLVGSSSTVTRPVETKEESVHITNTNISNIS